MRRLVIISAIVLTLIAAYMFFVIPLSDKRLGLKESLEAKYATLQKYEVFVKATGKTDTEFDAIIKEVEQMEANTLKAENESLASAKLHGFVQDFAEKTGIRIISIRPLSVVKYKHYSHLPIQIEASGEINQLSEFIKQIDTSKQLVRIDKLNINVVSMQNPGELRIRMQISGLIKV
ncbi:MAG: type 4a pilus biogenesis protein PilO [Nitrospirae bacterium]|nr:type 4a pilus biogenesis protein PilO [Nitrospirota bacterium]